jgi:hypothetical protein
MTNPNLRVALTLISEKARFHAERAETGSNLQLGLSEIDQIAKDQLAARPSDLQKLERLLVTFCQTPQWPLSRSPIRRRMTRVFGMAMRPR